MLFFQMMTRRYERASMVLTSKKSLEEWGEVFGDDVTAAALIDRVLHHCHIVDIRSNSFRMRHHRELWRTLQEGSASAPPRPKRVPRAKEKVTQLARHLAAGCDVFSRRKWDVFDRHWHGMGALMTEDARVSTTRQAAVAMSYSI